jgi:glycopeptide antibiotics resistance protein
VTPGDVGILVGVLLGCSALAGLAINRARWGENQDRFLGWCTLVIYLMILWVYAVAPSPEVGAVACRVPNLVTFPNMIGIEPGPRGLISDPSFQELVLNIALFVPLGTLLGLSFRRGIWTTTLIGFLISLAGEVVQLTGSVGLYPCAYRPESGHAGTSGRRILAIGIDVGTVLIGAIASIVFYRLVLTTGLERPFDVVNTAPDAVLGFAFAVIAQAAVLVSTGMTIGEQIVDLRRRRRDHDESGSV